MPPLKGLGVRISFDDSSPPQPLTNPAPPTRPSSGSRSVEDLSVGNASRTRERQGSRLRECDATDSSFSRHDSLINFGVSSSRNTTELKLLLGSSTSRLKPGATITSLYGTALDKEARKAHEVSLEQAKPRARVEVDIALESDCCVEGGYLRGCVKLRVRKRHKKEAPILIAEGKVRLIGFESVSGGVNHHTFYQRTSRLSEVTDAYSGVCDTPPDSEGFSRAMEGVHILPFAMHLPIDKTFGIAKGSPCLQSGANIRYIAMISVKVKDSNTGKRSIAHFYRDCQVWPRMDPSAVLASAPRPVQASTTKGLSVIGNGRKLRLTAALHRINWVAGQRCYVRVWVGNDTRKSVKSLTTTLVRTTTLFKLRPDLEPGAEPSVDRDACQASTTHKVVVEAVLQRAHTVAKGHASAEGWWTGVPAGQEAQFMHYFLIPPDALSVTRSRLIEVEYSVQVSVSAGPLTPDVHVTLPIRIINFLSIDPTPSAPLLSLDGSYARLIPYDCQAGQGYYADDGAGTSNKGLLRKDGANAFPPEGDNRLAAMGSTSAPTVPARSPKPMSANAPYHSTVAADRSSPSGHSRNDGIVTESESGCSLYSTESYPSTSPGYGLGNLDLEDGAGSDEEVEVVVSTAQLDTGRFPCGPRGNNSHLDCLPASSLEHGSTSASDDLTSRHIAIGLDGAPAQHSLPSTSGSQRSRHSGGRGNRATRRLHPNGARGRTERAHANPNAVVPNDRILKHDRDGAISNPGPVHPEGPGDVDGDSTPRPSHIPSAPVASAAAQTSSSPRLNATEAAGSACTANSHSQAESRRLPRPPPRALCGEIPSSVSALEAPRMTHLRTASRPTAAPAVVVPIAGLPPGGSAISASAMRRYLSPQMTVPAPPEKLLPTGQPALGPRARRGTEPAVVSTKGGSNEGVTSGAGPVFPRPANRRSETVPASVSGKALGSRPAAAMGDVVQADSPVRKRIAALEQRLKEAGGA